MPSCNCPEAIEGCPGREHRRLFASAPPVHGAIAMLPAAYEKAATIPRRLSRNRDAAEVRMPPAHRGAQRYGECEAEEVRDRGDCDKCSSLAIAGMIMLSAALPSFIFYVTA